MTSYEKDIADAIAALEHRLANREPGTDDHVFAAEFVQAMLGQGWRPTNAKPAPVTPSGPPGRLAAGLRAEALAAAEAATRRQRDRAREAEFGDVA